MKIKILIVFFIGFYTSYKMNGQNYNTVEKIVIPPAENRVVSITADLYKPIESAKGAFLMFHQAGASRGEFIETSQRLNRLGYICLAVDLRSGKSINEVDNETYKEAKAKMKGTSYLDAYIDMQASLIYFNNLIDAIYVEKSLPIYVMGSSYSAALTCRLAAEAKAELIDALFLFSPGEYFGNLNGDEAYVANFLKQIKKPIWATSSQNESSTLEKLLTNVPENTIHKQFKPSGSGQHGAKALWPQFVDSEEYWESMLSFLKALN